MNPDSTDHPLRYLFIDFNSYFSSVEQHDDPRLRGRPVIVTPLDSEHTGAIAASAEAKALGIVRGTSVRDARALCPEIAVRPARHERYVEIHNLAMAEIARHLPIARVYSIDECACRLDSTETAPAAGIARARQIKSGIARNLGPCLRSSIGIASSPLLAKLASELQKPDGLVVIEARNLPDALAGLPLAAIPGVGEGIARRLCGAGVTNFVELWNLAPKQARAIWGSVIGERFCYALKGHDIVDDIPRQKTSIGHSRVLSPQHQRPDEARIVARALLLKAASRLRLYGLYASRMTLGMRIRPSGWFDHECVLTATQNSWQFLKQLDALWAQLTPTLHDASSRSVRVASVSVDLHGLRDTPPDPDLLTPMDQHARDRRETRLWAEIDGLNRRFRRQTVLLASHRGLDLNYLGVKIAFSRVPDPLEFHC